jgi:hypothetical protein
MIEKITIIKRLIAEQKRIDYNHSKMGIGLPFAIEKAIKHLYIGLKTSSLRHEFI